MNLAMTENTPSMPKLLLSVREAASALNVCEKTLYSYTVPRGTIKCLKIGTRMLYVPADLREWIDKQKGATDA